MQTDPAIKAALVAAGEAAWQRIDQLGFVPPDTPEAEKIAAAAVAAFLRALPKPGGTIAMRDVLELGAAVEKAAKEQGRE